MINTSILIVAMLKTYCDGLKYGLLWTLAFASMLLLIVFEASANTPKLSIPRFASIKSNEVNARSGPSIKSPVEWVFVKKGEPVEITAEYEQWRQIRDIKGEGGWVHLSVLSGKRSIIVIGKEIINLTKTSEEGSNIIAKVSPEVRCKLNKCNANWCKVSCGRLQGWLPKKILWGVYASEVF